jgi:glycosyltransferase involved in cell wall biosynthesis/SAM-dependent methyltransferase
MRILVAGLGGVSRAFRNWPERVIALELVRRGHEVRALGMIYPRIPALTAEREMIDGVEMRRVPQAYWPNRALARALDEGERPDVIHLFHPRNVLAAQVTAWARRRGVPTVYTWLGPLHDEYLVADRERPLDGSPRYDRLIWTRSALLRRLPGARSLRELRDLLRNYRLHGPLRAARHLVPCSRFEAEELRRMGLEQPQTVVPLWIDAAALETEPRSEPGVEASRPWLLFVGQLTPRKGYDVAIAALPRIVERYPTATLLVVSGINTADREALERQAADLGVAGHVRFLGRLEDPALVRLFRACDVYLTPTRYEGFGLTILEAMACGAPVVASDVPAANEVVRHEENGLLVPSGDVGAFAAATARLLEDPALRERLRAGGRRTALEDFSGERLVAELEDVYREATRRPPVDGEAAYFEGQVRKSDRKIAVQYARILERAGLAEDLPEGPALDVGCGAGPGLRYLAMRGVAAIGVDRSFYALRQAAARAQSRGLVQGDALLGFPFRDGAFGLVVASEVIEHLPDGIAFLRECRRILRRGGVLILTTPNLWDVRRLVKPLVGQTWSGHADPTHVNLYTPRRLSREMEMAGFAAPRVRTGMKPMVWLPPFDRAVGLPYPPLIGNGIVATGTRT